MLEPERVKGAELGLDWNNGLLKMGVTAFYNQLDNAIANVTLATGPGVFPGVGFVAPGATYSQRQNLQSIRSRGLEIDALFDLGDLTDGLTFRAGYSYVDAEVEGTGDAASIDGLRPAQVPRHNASGTVAWARENGTGASLSARYIGQQFEDDVNQLSLADAFTVDGRMSLAINDRLLVETRVENLFDARVEAAISSNGIIERAFPRTFWIGLRTRFE